MPPCSRCGAFWGKLEMNQKLMKVYIVCFVSMFATGYTITMLFPFLPFMVAFLLPNVPKTTLAKYAGYVASAVFAGRFVGCYVWGAITDYKGRKPVIIASGLLLASSTFVFGFSANYEMAIVLRFLIGVSNGIAVAARAAISDVSSDSNQALGLSLLSCAWGVGLVLGPAFSGLTADPITQYNLTLENGTLKSFLTSFPFATPCILSSLVCVISVLLTVCLMPETAHPKVNTSDGYTQVPTTIGLPQTPSEQDHTHFQDSPSDEEECGDVDLGTLGQKLDDSEDEDDSYPLAPPLCNHGNSPTHSSTTNGTVQELEVDADIVDLRPNMDPRQRLSMDTQMLSMDTQMFSMDPFRTNTDPLRTRGASTGRHVNTSSNLHVVATNSKIGLPDQFPDHSQQSLSKRSCNCACSPERCGHPLHLIKCACSPERCGHPLHRIKCACSPERCGHPLHRIKGWVRDFVTLIRGRLVLMTVTVYCALSFSAIGFDELYSLWCATPLNYGGLEFTAKEIGLSLAVAGGILLPIGLVLYPLLERRFRSINTFQMNAILFMLVVMLFPFIHRLRLSIPVESFWVILILALVVYNVTNATIFSAMSLLINNSVTKDKVGSVNGLALSATSLVRTAATSFTGGVYSFSLSDQNIKFGYPIDYHLVFLIFGFIVLLVIFIVACLPESINNHLTEEDASKFQITSCMFCLTRHCNVCSIV